MARNSADSNVVVDLERELIRRAERLTRVEPEECLYCYLCRMTDQFGCNGTSRFTQKWIDAQPPSHRWVIKWAQSLGGYCDCEVVMNTFRDELRSQRHQKVRCERSYDVRSGRE